MMRNLAIGGGINGLLFFDDMLDFVAACICSLRSDFEF